MVDSDQTGKKEDDASRQAHKEPAAESIQRDPSRAATATGQTSAATAGAERERTSAAAGADMGAGETFTGRMGSAMTDTMQSVSAAGGGAVDVTRDVLKNVISATEDVGTGLVGGVRHLATEVVLSVGDVGETAVHTATGLLVGLVGGVKTVIGEVVPRGGRGMMPTEARRGTGEEAEARGSRAERQRAEEMTH